MRMQVDCRLTQGLGCWWLRLIRPRSSSACYSLILVLARGWVARGGPGLGAHPAWWAHLVAPSRCVYGPRLFGGGRIWWWMWHRSSSACYSLILVLARVGWRGGPGRVRIGLVVAHFSLGGERHALGARQLDWVAQYSLRWWRSLTIRSATPFKPFSKPVGAFGPHRWASTLWRASVRPVYPAVPLVHSFRGQSGGANPSLVWWAAPFLFDVLV